MADYSTVLEPVVLIPAHYFVLVFEMPNALERLQWGGDRLNPILRVRDFGADNWKRLRLAVSYCLFDRRLARIERVSGYTVRYSWVLWLLCVITIIGAEATKGATGVFAERLETLLMGARFGVAAPLIMAVFIRWRVYKLDQFLRLGKRNPDAILRI